MTNSSSTQLLDRIVYGMSQVDRLLLLKAGTAKRWIDGYTRSGKIYPPVVRIAATGEELVKWGEFVETRLLSEYRNAGVPMHHMRHAIERLREQFNTQYPLAYAWTFLEVQGKELVLKVQEQTQLEKRLHLVVVRNNQMVLAPEVERFVNAVDYGKDNKFAQRLRPSKHVVIDPLRHFGDPVVRNVPTEVIAELIAAGDTMDMVSTLYELSPEQVEDAVRYELRRTKCQTKAAA